MRKANTQCPIQLAATWFRRQSEIHESAERYPCSPPVRAFLVEGCPLSQHRWLKDVADYRALRQVRGARPALPTRPIVMVEGKVDPAQGWTAFLSSQMIPVVWGVNHQAAGFVTDVAGEGSASQIIVPLGSPNCPKVNGVSGKYYDMVTFSDPKEPGTHLAFVLGVVNHNGSGITDIHSEVVRVLESTPRPATRTPAVKRVYLGLKKRPYVPAGPR